MKTSIKNRKKQFLALCLAMMMASSVTALAACKKDSSESSSSSSSSVEQEKDTLLVKNGGFETFDTKNGTNLIGTSVTGWSRSNNSTSSGSAFSSKSASGIIDTAKESWDNLTTNTVSDVKALTEDEAKKNWNSYTAKDKLEYYDAWEDAHKDDDIDEDLEFYQSFNIDSEDLPTCENPGTHDNDEKDTKILMIHNNYPTWGNYKDIGTAQKYTSSTTVTVKAGTAAEFSVWVKTSNLTSASTNGEPQEAVDKGAYISVNHSVGSKTLEAFQVKNINTKDVEENNGWKQYSFYLNSTSYADTTFTITLGLGQGGGDDKWEYVSGYAFFDDIECNVITRESFDEKTQGMEKLGFDSTKKDKTVDTAVSPEDKFALDFYGEFAALDLLSETVSLKETTEKLSSGKEYTAAANVAGVQTYPGLGFDTANDVKKVFNNVAAMDNSGNEYLQAAYDEYFKDKDFLADSKVLMLLSADGAAYTATSGKTFTVDAGKYLAISFYVKTSDLNGFTGASVNLHDGNGKTSISSIDTSSIATVDIGDDKDIYDGWQQCLFYVQNETDAAKTFHLSFNYGPTTVVGTAKSAYYAGFAAFAGFQQYEEMDSAMFDSVTSGTYAQIVSLTGNVTEAAGDDGFDSTATVPADAIETGFAHPRNYKGVYSSSAYVNNSGTDIKINQNANAGLLNKEYADNYTSILTKLGKTSWQDAFGDATQPLVIYNEGEQKEAYGFIGKSTSIAANTYATISLRVKVSSGAKAFVYLMDMDDNTHQNTLSIGRQVSYWYDDDGNVCAIDPSDEHFNAKKHVAFKLQSNGLYKVNPTWNDENKAGLSVDAFYANLANYEKDANGNLIVADGGVSYNYNNKWDNEGQDGIAFYAKDGVYYADRACTIAVNDFATATALTPRYAALETNKGMAFEVNATNNDWATVTFYVHTGDTSKNYRLEVWSGSRYSETNIVNPAGSYVIVDANKPADVDATSFAKLIEQRKDETSEDNYFESVFSFYDSAKYLRYNEKIDENEVGNSYESYLSSAYTEGVAYLKYEGEGNYEIFADYALSEVTVEADVEEDDTTEEEEDDHDHEGETNVWLLASSISIAAVLVLAVVSIIVRKVVTKVRKNNAHKEKKVKKNDK